MLDTVRSSLDGHLHPGIPGVGTDPLAFLVSYLNGCLQLVLEKLRFTIGPSALDHLGAARRERDKPQLVQDDQPLFERLGQQSRKLMLILGLDQFVGRTGSVVETDSVPLPAHGKGKAGCDVTLSETGISHQEDRFSLVYVDHLMASSSR